MSDPLSGEHSLPLFSGTFVCADLGKETAQMFSVFSWYQHTNRILRGSGDLNMGSVPIICGLFGGSMALLEEVCHCGGGS